MTNTEKFELYKCDLCGNIVEVMQKGAKNLICCGQKMKQLEENTVDAAKEKHVPVIEKITGGYKVKLGSVPHPMTDEHIINWIELVSIDGSTISTKFLIAGEAPEAVFLTDEKDVYARAYCNLHGNWKNI